MSEAHPPAAAGYLLTTAAARVDAQIHGQGTREYAIGNKYVGEWSSGKISGYGKLFYVDGDVYEGQWKEEKMHGKGVYTYHNGDQYDGEWREDKRHGKGTVTYAADDSGAVEKYTGDWVEGKMHGLGRCVHSSDSSQMLACYSLGTCSSSCVSMSREFNWLTAACTLLGAASIRRRTQVLVLRWCAV